MTFFSFFIFTSYIYFSQCMPTDIIPPIPEVSIPNYQENIEGFMKEISIAAEKHLHPLLEQMDTSDQQRVVEYGITSFISYIEYMLQVISFNEDVKIAKESLKRSDASDSEDDSHSEDDDDSDSNYNAD